MGEISTCLQVRRTKWFGLFTLCMTLIANCYMLEAQMIHVGDGQGQKQLVKAGTKTTQVSTNTSCKAVQNT